MKNDSRYTTPSLAPSTTASYASRDQSSRLTKVDCPTQKTSRKSSSESKRYSSVGSEVGSGTELPRARSTRVPGRIVRSMWQ